MYLQNKAVYHQNPNFSVCMSELYINWTLIPQFIWNPQLYGLLESFSPLEFIHYWAITTILRKLIGGSSLKECCCYCTHSLKHTGSLHYSARNILIQLHQRSCSLYKFSEKKKLFFCSRICSGSFRNSFSFLLEWKKILEKWNSFIVSKKEPERISENFDLLEAMKEFSFLEHLLNCNISVR